jgi:hypothetical protein
MVRLIVGKSEGDGFVGYWAEFADEEISSYTDGKGVVYTLYKCTDYTQMGDAYRVHILDETDPEAPTYQLLPYDDQTRSYPRPYDNRQVAATYPLIIKHIDFLAPYTIDPM